MSLVKTVGAGVQEVTISQETKLVLKVLRSFTLNSHTARAEKNLKFTNTIHM